MISITIGRWMVGIDWNESLPSQGKVRFFVFDLESDDNVFVLPLW